MTDLVAKDGEGIGQVTGALGGSRADGASGTSEGGGLEEFVEVVQESRIAIGEARTSGPRPADPTERRLRPRIVELGDSGSDGGGECPVAPATAAVPPHPRACASVAAQRRRTRWLISGARAWYFARSTATFCLEFMSGTCEQLQCRIDQLILRQLLSSSFAYRKAYGERPGRRKSPRRFVRGAVRHSGIPGRSASHPVRLRSWMSWASQVFSRVCFPSKPSVFSS